MAFVKYKPSSPMPRVGFKLDPKQIFFDRKPVIDAIGAVAAKAMSASAREIKRSAKRSMKYVTAMPEQERLVKAGKRKRFRAVKVSKPGEPPKAIRPHPFVKKLLWHEFDLRTMTAVIGPKDLRSRATGAPRILEHGGMIPRRKNKRRTRRVMGGTGELRIGGRVTRSTKDGVTYGRLHTARQVARANTLNKDLYGPEFTGGKMQKARPFMGPALMREIPNMRKRFGGSVHN